MLYDNYMKIGYTVGYFEDIYQKKGKQIDVNKPNSKTLVVIAINIVEKARVIEYLVS